MAGTPLDSVDVLMMRLFFVMPPLEMGKLLPRQQLTIEEV